MQKICQNFDFFFRIPDELLLKYTKADSLCQDDYQVERNVSPGKKMTKCNIC